MGLRQRPRFYSGQGGGKTFFDAGPVEVIVALSVYKVVKVSKYAILHLIKTQVFNWESCPISCELFAVPESLKDPYT